MPHTSAETDATGPDIVQEVLQRVRAVNPALTEEQASQVEADIRSQYGGMRVRIPKRGKWLTPEQRAQVIADGMTAQSNDEIIAKHKISRRSLYYYMKRNGG